MESYVIDVLIGSIPFILSSIGLFIIVFIVDRVNSKIVNPYRGMKLAYLLPLCVLVLGLYESSTSPSVTYKHETFDESLEYRENRAYRERLDKGGDKVVSLDNLTEPEEGIEERRKYLEQTTDWKSRGEE